MQFQYLPYVGVLLAAAAVTLALAIYALRQKDVRGTGPFGVCMLLTALWSGSNALEMAGADLSAKLFWTNVQCMAYTSDPVIWLIMVFRFIERDHWITGRNILLLLALPALTVVLAWTNDLHGLMWQNVRLDTSGPFPILSKTFGTWFWVIAAYSYFLIILAEALLALSLRRKSALYREQSLALFIGLALLLIQNALYIFGIHPVTRYDLTPVVAGVSGLVVAWGVFRYRLFDVVPVARDKVVENMDDGLIVLDGQNRIADMNPKVKSLFGNPFGQVAGQEAAAFFADWPAVAEICRNGANPPRELVVENAGCPKIFEVAAVPLRDSRGKDNGLSIILHDVTERKKAESQLLEQQRTLAITEERERMARELHDSLGQVLGYINIQAQAVREQIVRGQTETAADCLERLRDIARNSHDDLREYIRSARGIALPNWDLVAALRNYLQQYNQNYRIKTELTIPGDLAFGRLEAAAGRQLLRIIQEALTNVRKHAGADTVKITFAEKQGFVEVAIEDRGCGFDRKDMRSGEHFGLAIMEERAREAGGRLEIATKPGQGTKVVIEIPLSGEEIRQ
jgi:PAS domain S-box-containing protein